MATYYVNGQISLKNGQLAKDFRVQLYRRVGTRTQYIGRPSKTTSKGTYSISFDFKQPPFSTRKVSPFENLYLRISAPDGKVIKDIKSEVTNTRLNRILLNARLDYAVAVPEPQNYRVSGTVTLDNGRLPYQFSVEAFDRDLRNQQLLGVVTLDKDGRYQITYSSEQVMRAERGTADLFVRVLDPRGHVVATSDVVYNAPTQAKIDVSVEARTAASLSQYEAMMDAVPPLLGNLSITQLQHNEKLDDLTFLSGETGYSISDLRRLVLAHRLLSESDVDPPFWFILLSELGDLNGRTLSASLDRAKRQMKRPSTSDIRQALQRGMDLDVIARVPDQTINNWLSTFDYYLANVEEQLDGSFVLNTVEDLGLSKSDSGRKLTRLLLKEGAFTPVLRQQLEKDNDFDAATIDALDVTYQLATITNSPFSIVQNIRKGFDIQRPADLRRLAKQDLRTWNKVLQLDLDDEGDKSIRRDFQEGYTAVLRQQVVRRFPTAAFTGDLERAAARNGIEGLQHATTIQNALEKREELDLRTTPVETYISASSALKSNPDAQMEFKAVHRLFKISPDFQAVQTLLADRVHSAQQIYRMGRKGFITRYSKRKGFSATIANRTWELAEGTHAASVSLVAELKSVELASRLSFVPLNVDFSNFPNWENLFQSGDRCQCTHCQSVYSPAAYFADLLHFLKDRRTSDTTARDLLFDRRPDLAHLELSCANANTPLPYIDVVNEVLEAAIANKENNQVLNLSTITNTPDGREAVLSALEDAGLLTGDNPYLSQVGNSDEWVWHSDAITYRLFKTGLDYSASILRNTKASKEVLRARPQYTNPAAYAKLKQAVYPLALPFDIDHTKAAAAFDQVNIERWRLMELFRGNSTPNDPSDLAIAATYFGLATNDDLGTDDALSILVNAAPTDQPRYWGVNSEADLLSNAQNVRRLLDTTQLEYTDLLTLLDLPFVNPEQVVTVLHDEAGSCDLDKKFLSGLDTAFMDRLHRFLRFWRTSGWVPWEIDAAIRHPNVGNGALDSNFLLQAFELERLRDTLGKGWSIEKTLALFGDINTRTNFLELHQARTPALYQRLFLDTALNANIDPAFELAAVTSANPTAQLVDHLPTLQAALGISETDLNTFLELRRASNGNRYIPNGENGALSLANLSFLYRQQQLSSYLGLSAADWQLLTVYYDQDLDWTDANEVRAFVEQLATLLNSDLDLPTVAYLLAADTAAPQAPTEEALTGFLTNLRAALKSVQTTYDAQQYDHLQAGTEDAAQAEALLRTLLGQANRSQADVDQILAILKNETGHNGALSGAERELIRFVQPQFTSPLASLPAQVDFSTLEEALAAKIQYDANAQILVLSGFLSDDDLADLQAQSNDPAYLAALDNLNAQPLNGTFPSWQLWLEPNELTFNGAPEEYRLINLVKATQDALLYWTAKGQRDVLETQLSQQVGLPTSLVRTLTRQYPPNVTPHYYDYLLVDFSATTAPVAYADQTRAYDGLHWLHRVALLADALNLDARLLNWLEQYASPTNTLDPYKLPQNNSGSSAPLQRLLNTIRLQQLNSAFTEDEGVDLWRLMAQTVDGDFADQAAFAEAVALASDWTAADIDAFVNHTDLTYPNSFEQLDAWERLDASLRIARLLNAGTNTVLPFAAAAMTATAVATLEQLLLAKYGEKTWDGLQKDIQDVLREQKRNALVAYLLSQPAPSDAPSEKWLNANDLYAYFLLDVEMSSCMLTSRLVQGSGSIQLFVQRGLLGLEPNLIINTEGDEGDGAWHWWQWMRKYRVWEANRKVFLYPENWTEPELRRDRSPLFKQLEQQILQQEISQENVEKAFTQYLEGLGEIANLEIAGYFQEDDGDAAILHLIGRTRRTDPHLYYYRRYDYRQWTPWERIEVGITGDHLVPIVVDKLLYLYWPEFREMPNQEANGNVSLPKADSNNSNLPMTISNVEMRLAMTVLRNGQWSDKKVSTDALLSANYVGGLDLSKLSMYAIDLRHAGEELGIVVEGGAALTSILPNQRTYQLFEGFFSLFGARGLPELLRTMPPHTYRLTSLTFPDFVNQELIDRDNIKNLNYPQFNTSKLTLTNHWSHNRLVDKESNFLEAAFGSLSTILDKVPDRFSLYFGRHLSYFDRLLDRFRVGERTSSTDIAMGQLLPFSYEDRNRSFMAFPVVEEDDRHKPLYYLEKKDRTQEAVHEALSLLYYRVTKGDVEGFIAKNNTADSKDIRKTWFNLALNVMKRWDERQSSVSASEFEQMVRYTFPSWTMTQVAPEVATKKPRYHFTMAYHPFAEAFTRLIYDPTEGIDALMSRSNQLRSSPFDFLSFENQYKPTQWVYGTKEGESDHLLPKEEVDFSPKGQYSSYNWELFYHAPLLIANNLSKNQQFEKAMHWYHYIFNPLGVEGLLPDGSLAEAPHKFWITKPFFLKSSPEYQQERIDSILNMLAGNEDTNGYGEELKEELESQVRDWRQNPFDPHRVAQYRTVAYQKNVFMKYLDNLIAWGDQLFRQDSMESINEAIQLYILTAELLGPKPRSVAPAVKPQTATYLALESDFDAFGNALVQVENYVPSLPPDYASGRNTAPIPTLYFCIPENDKILGYWDVVADRLYKIRNCMNIDGVKRSLALFEPAIDPGALVKAVAGGLSIGAALADRNAPLPYYRFEILIQKANAVCADVRVLGNSLLSTLEKKDAEGLALLRAEHEIKIQKDLEAIRQAHIDELHAQIEALEKGKAIHEKNYEFYKKKINEGIGAFKLTGWETSTMTLKGLSVAAYTGSIGLQILAATTHLLPDFAIGFSGFGGTPKGDAKTGGDSIGKSLGKTAKVLKLSGEVLSKNAEMTEKMGYYQSRAKKWKHQRDVHEAEMERIDAQIATSELAIERAEKELALQEQRSEQAQGISDYMTDKYTNQELYQWLMGEVSNLYFRRYELAYDLAKKAERCYRFELGTTDTNFIQFGHWNSLKKGLLAGEHLQHDLRRLETAYLDNNRRELELTKHCSLRQLNPEALLDLQAKGYCNFQLPEELFDLDYPGHYFRRIQSVRISLPCVAGPHTTIAATLTMTNNYIRTQTTGLDNYARDMEAGDARFVQSNIPSSAIATSHAQKDSGLFELRFSDPRYLPFEGAGAISDWSLELFHDDRDGKAFGKALRQFDYSSISDAIIHVQYTARQAGGLLKNAALDHLKATYQNVDEGGRAVLLHLRQDFASAWFTFLNPADEESANTMTLQLERYLFPFLDQGKPLVIKKIHTFLQASDSDDYDLTLTPNGEEVLPMPQLTDKGDWHYVAKDVELTLSATEPLPTWDLTLASPSGEQLATDEVQEILLVLEYEWNLA